MKSYTTIQKLFAIDLRSLALFRVSLGLAVLHSFITLSSEFRAFYTGYGILPAGFFISQIKEFSKISIFLINDSEPVVLLLFCLAIFATLSFIVGWKTRWSSFWMWFFLMSLHARNPFVIRGGDNLVRYLTFWCLFLPLGERYAFDASPSSTKKIECSPATFALMMQTCYIYLFATYFKSNCPEWLNGQGIKCALEIRESLLPFGRFLLQFQS